MRPGSTAFTEAWLKKISKDPSMRGKTFTDALCRGLMIWVASDGVITFTYRMRVPDVKKRVFEKLGSFSTAFTLNHAREAANMRRSAIGLYGVKPKNEVPTLGAAIPKYEHARNNRDRQASRRGAPMRDDWPEHRDRFKKVFAELLERKVSHLSREDFVNCMGADGAYAKEWVRNERIKWEARPADTRSEKPKEWDPRVLRPMMVCLMPMLNWCTKSGQRWLDERELEALIPEDYDKDDRYLLPGEWQACAPHVDALDDDCGIFPRFVLYSAVRSEQALGMEWTECNWATPEKWIDDQGQVHDAVIWIVPKRKRVGRMKGRAMGGDGNTMPNRVLLVGESLVLLKRLRAIYEENQKLPEHAGYTKVFTQRMITSWRTARTTMQRGIEKKGGTKPWDRMTLRHTHATYLPAIGCPERLVTMSMTHTVREKLGVALVTAKRYIGTDPARRFMENDPMAELAPWLYKFHKLLKDIEAGHLSDTLACVIGDMMNGQLCNNMCERYGLQRKFISIDVRSQPPKLQMVGT
jgi:integrase